MSDVAPGSSPEPEDQPSGSPAGQSGGSGEGRSIENVHKELQRKLDKGLGAIQNQAENQIGELRDMVQDLTLALRGQSPAPKAQNPLDAPAQQAYGMAPVPAPAMGGDSEVANLDMDTLNKALKHPQLSQVDRQRVIAEITARTIDSRAAELQQKRQQEMSLTEARDKAFDRTMRAFPAMRDEGSEFYKKVATRIQERRQAVGSQPMEVWDSANEVAREMNVEVQRGALGSFVAPTEGGQAPEEQNPYLPSEERQKELADRFRGTLPKGKDFDMKRINQRAEEYGTHSELYIGGPGMRGRRG